MDFVTTENVAIDYTKVSDSKAALLVLRHTDGRSKNEAEKGEEACLIFQNLRIMCR